METYINEWVDADGRRHILYMPLSLDELPLGDFYSQALEIVLEEPKAPFPTACESERRPFLQRARDWLVSFFAYDPCTALDAQD